MEQGKEFIVSKKLFCVLFSIVAIFLCLGLLGVVEIMLFGTKFLCCIGAAGVTITTITLIACFVVSELKE